MNITDRFLRYAALDTQSAPDCDRVPSTEKQLALAQLLARELKEMGAADVHLDSHGYVYASIPASQGLEDRPVLGFISHMDTAPACSGADIKARIVPNYDGREILLNRELNLRLSPADFEGLARCKGQDLIVTDGTTLLGADDKAGIAEIMTMAQTLLTGDRPHGAIRIAFTPDEEVGNGPAFFDVKGFGADFAYTVDGGELGELEYENFNAAGVKVTIRGKSIHPGSAKNKMINAILVAMELQRLLPMEQNPAFTEGYEGFFHLDELQGTVEKASMDYIIRDHDAARFQEKKDRFLAAVDYLNGVYGAGTVTAVVSDSYRNMKEQILPHFHLIRNAQRAMEKVGVTPMVVPIRGGTDGARLSFMGLPCPNLCTGGFNFHGPFEFISIQSMEKVTQLLLALVEQYTLPQWNE